MSDIAVRRYRVPVPSIPAAMSPLRIAHISDLHFRWWTPFLDRFQRRLARLDFDLLIMTGDFCEWPVNWRQGAAMLRRFLEPFRAPLGHYAVPGNHDHRMLAEQFDGAPVRFLRNESVQVGLNGSAIHLAGIDDGWRSVADVPKALKDCRDGRTTLLLTHMPSAIHHLPEGVVDLVLSGHTHAGQWRLPWRGDVMVTDKVNAVHTHGLHRVGRRWLHVTSGVGASGPFRFRLNCPAEIALLTLVRERLGSERI